MKKLSRRPYLRRFRAHTRGCSPRTWTRTRASPEERGVPCTCSRRFVSGASSTRFIVAPFESSLPYILSLVHRSPRARVEPELGGDARVVAAERRGGHDGAEHAMVHQPARAEPAHVPPVFFFRRFRVDGVVARGGDASDQRQRPQVRPRRVRADAVSYHVNAPSAVFKRERGVRRGGARHELARGGGGARRDFETRISHSVRRLWRRSSRRVFFFVVFDVPERHLTRAPRVGDGRAVLLRGPDQQPLGPERRDVRRPENAGRVVGPAPHVFIPVGKDGHELDDVPPLQLRGQDVALEFLNRPRGGAARDDHGVVRARLVKRGVPRDGRHGSNLHRRRAPLRRLAGGREKPRGVPQRREVPRRVQHQALGYVQRGGHGSVFFSQALRRSRLPIRASQRTREERRVVVVVIVFERTSRRSLLCRLEHLRRHVHPRDQPPQLLRGDCHTPSPRLERRGSVLREVARLLQRPRGTTHTRAARDGAPAVFARRNRRTRFLFFFAVHLVAFRRGFHRRRLHRALGVLRRLDQLERRGNTLRASPYNLSARRVRVQQARGHPGGAACNAFLVDERHAHRRHHPVVPVGGRLGVRVRQLAEHVIRRGDPREAGADDGDAPRVRLPSGRRLVPVVARLARGATTRASPPRPDEMLLFFARRAGHFASGASRGGEAAATTRAERPRHRG
mmetsp:Transcript_4674/g.19890  ORF Transcript_4674/g.19890 Transcript_4674/m.19890 type:complete len:680 (+) Transcript_4674:1048-3087(+)